MSYKPKSNEELKEIALGMMGGSIFSSDHLLENEADLIGMVFMGVTLLEPIHREKMRSDNITFFYQDMNEALPRAINGRPCFMNFKMLNQADRERMHAIRERLQAAIEAV